MNKNSCLSPYLVADKVPHTSAYLKVNACFAVAARAFKSWFDEPNNMHPDGLTFKKSSSFPALYAPLKAATQEVDSTTRTYVRTAFGIMYSKFEKAWAARNEKLQGFRYYEDPESRGGAIKQEFSRRSCANIVLQAAVAAAIESSVKEVNDYLTKRIENKNRCEALKRLLDSSAMIAGYRRTLYETPDNKRYHACGVIIPPSFRPRLELWKVMLLDIDAKDGNPFHETIYLPYVMDEASFYGLAQLVFDELDSEPLGLDVPVGYPFPIDRAPVFPTKSVRIISVK
jgi:hypothetical protein